jgi:hypothetical protein
MLRTFFFGSPAMRFALGVPLAMKLVPPSPSSTIRLK